MAVDIFHTCVEVFNPHAITKLAPPSFATGRLEQYVPRSANLNQVSQNLSRISETDPIFQRIAQQLHEQLLKPENRKVDQYVACPTSSAAQGNLTIKINFDILRFFSSCDILTIY
jgi:hypothetical protein